MSFAGSSHGVSQQKVMARTLNVRRALSGIESFLGHTVAVVVGLVMMVIGLGLGVTMIMLPVGIVIGLLGVAVFLAGLFGRIGRSNK
jgi:hypothetical protein